MKPSLPLVLSASLLLAGCGGDTPAPPPTNPTSRTHGNPATNTQVREMSTTETIVGGFSGATAARKGRETMDKVRAINKKEQADLEEAMR